MHLRLTAAALLVSLTLPAASATSSSPINPASYPKLSPRQLQVLREVADRAQQPLTQWPRAQFGYGPTAGSTNPADSDLIYQVRADASALAQAQYDKVPAYRDLYQRSMDALIQKMLDPTTWGAWYELSRWEDGLLFDKGGPQIDPWADPFLKHNIMYSGNLFQMLGYYAMLYGDRKYDAPGALTYVWNRDVARTVGSKYDGPEQVFKYNHTGLAKALHRQYVEGQYVGIACQPKYAFTLCNEVPILGYRHFDLTHGTRYAPEVEQRFMANERWDSRTQRFMIFVNQKTREPHFVQPEQQLAGDPIGGMYWHHTINPALVKKSYQYHRDIALQFYAGNVREAIRDQGIGFSFFANYAAEVGDLTSRDKLISYADRNFDPVTDQGRFRYPVNDIAVPPEKEKHFEVWQGNDKQEGKRTVFGGQANSLMAMAVLNDGGAQWRLYNRPWPAAKLREPHIAAVNYPAALVNQAVYDSKKDALIIGMLPGSADAQTTARFDVHQLSPTKRYTIEVDGKPFGQLQAGKVSGEGLGWSPDGVLSLRLALPAERSIIVRGMP